MSHTNWRDEIWSTLDQAWDVIIIGGGITGAGILREAARLGLRVLLVEQRDFAWGTSSRSSKLVHGGLRYLATGQFRLTYASVREREQLLKDVPGLIERLGFLMTVEEDKKIDRWKYTAGLSLYDLMALQWSHHYYDARELQMLAPPVNMDNLDGGFHYEDAQTDDARLVLRVLQEGLSDGGVALNYVRAERVLEENGQVTGVHLVDQISERSVDVHARGVINATGAWADHLRTQMGETKRIRPLRGSHLIFPAWRLPLAQAVAFDHPIDGRYVFAFPWEGVTLLGTTDVDHQAELNTEPRISPDEVAYLMAAAVHEFPSCNLTLDDVVATFAGVRPVIGTGKEDPSKEARDHVVWQENGLLTVTGGKLTTFRVIALDALRAIREQFPELANLNTKTSALDSTPIELAVPGLDQSIRQRLIGRYGTRTAALIGAAQPGELSMIPGSQTLWAELRWAARTEAVVHLDDLLLRRVRIGLLLPNGAAQYLPRIREICQVELGWDDEKWAKEEAAYLDLWNKHYGLPERASIPDWQEILNHAQQSAISEKSQSPLSFKKIFAALLFILFLLRLRLKQHASSIS
jgi:glycerol-3-phosphate dehydrogenase